MKAPNISSYQVKTVVSRIRASRQLMASIFFAVWALATSTSHGYLGGFKDLDGYRPFLNDVVTYDAGQYGLNTGGSGTATPITPNTGLWRKLQGPLFPTLGLAGGVAYGTGHQNLDRTNPSTADQALVITTNADGWNLGPQEYAYSVDSFDLGGYNPLSTGGQTVQVSFWSCAQIWGTAEGGGLGPNTIGHTVAFLDSGAQLGFQVGYNQPGTSQDFAAYNVNGTWVQTAIQVYPHTWHRWDVTMDLSTNQVSIDLYDTVLNQLNTLVTNAPMINSLANFTEMRFVSTAGVNNAKVWALDDFTMQVPEPSSAFMCLAASAGTFLFRRSRRFAS